ncbi:GATOR complex protein Wdr59 [Lucilia sericata]|uniref:GATOR complex protein Wdr59 n=1 Tax=Lucilia sericata TaxID=13632 RepID=UPI0018A868C3|nr:GATOR complex protein Wdr59 [Lucilia sericata]
MPSTDTLRNVERGGERELSSYIRQSDKVYEHRESQATAMTVDYTGQWVLLAGRRHLALQCLGQDDDDGFLRKYNTNSKYEVSAAEFAICPESKESCAIATSQHIDVVTWGAAEPRYIHSLRGHTRMVTDIDWHGKNPNLLASCSIDTFSHIWDLRDSRKPTLSFSAVCMSGATQVGFNRVSGNLLAAAHDGDLRIWDIRKGSCPIHYITAHLNRVHGINWSHRRETCLATASQDGTVKYFDINNPRRAEKIITTTSPVWRARYTPIGNGLVSIVVPHLGRGENSLLLWSNSKQNDPVCSFVGHTDVILDFAWRPNRMNQMEIELVTWSRDRTLRVWKIDDKMLMHCEPDNDSNENYDMTQEMRIETPTKFQPMHSSSFQKPSLLRTQPVAASLPIEAIDALHISNMVRSRSPPPTISLRTPAHRRKEETAVARSLTDQPTCSLHHEFSLLNTNMPHIEVDVLDAIKRYAVFNISAGGHVIVLQTTFPTEYPSPNICPEFTFCPGTTIHENLTRLMMKVLKTNALTRVKKSRTCLEQCLRALVTAMKKSGGGSDKSQMRLQSPRLEGALSGALHDACIPFPRTSAATFNPVGMLCSFAQVLNTKRLTLRHQNTTPRTLSAINGGGLLGNVMGPQPVLYTHRDSNASFYLQDRMSSKHAKNRSIQKPVRSTAIVHIYECYKLLNISRIMAKEYSLDKRNIIETCRKNRQICENHGRYDLLPIWTMAEMIATPNVPQTESMKYEMILNEDPFKKCLLEALIMHFASMGDLQTAVMLACLFHPFGINGMSVCGSGVVGGAGTSGANVMASSSNNLSYHSKLPNLTPNTSPYHTVLPIDTHASPSTKNGATGSNVALYLKQLRSNSWSDSLDCVDSKHVNSELYACSLIRRSRIPLFDQFKKLYAEILYGWQLLTIRSLILKHTAFSKSPPQGVEFVTECSGCNKTKRTSACGPCQRPVLFCALCCIPVKGAANACLACGHGGHLMHMMQWFEKHNVCASGCGCHCLEQTALMLEYIK